MSNTRDKLMDYIDDTYNNYEYQVISLGGEPTSTSTPTPISTPTPYFTPDPDLITFEEDDE